MSKGKTIEYIQIMEEQVRRNNNSRLERIYESFYDWQMKFVAGTKDYTVAALLGGNRVGKTRTGLVIDAYHLRGDYPENWPGVKYDFPPLCWLLGYSGEKTRDLLQYKLFGRYIEKRFEGGLIPADRIVSHLSMQGTSGAMREVRVKHVNGISTCQFWSYSQGQSALMGDNVDHFHFDEEAEKPDIFPQVVTRTLTGNRGKGGGGILTLTPEYGKTQLICKLMGESSDLEEGEDEINIETDSMYLQTATWDQCPHIDEDARRKIMSIYPAHQKKMRSMGVPLMGAGLIYDVDEDLIKCKPFEIPDYWFVINGLDFGWNHPQAHIQLVWDRDADIYYVINAWKASRKQPFEAWHVIKKWAENIPTAWPSDGLQTEKGSAKQQRVYYKDEGFNLLSEHATWEDGGNGRWAGIVELNNLMKTGRLKIVSSLHEVFEELRQYHTKDTGNGKSEIVKIKDDLLDAIRYAYMMRRHAIRIMDLYQDDYQHLQQDQSRDDTTGY
ncbi:MAG: DNA packaging protein [Gammaproteobacteria bacterium]|nr:DNA packaging protein [Gammaproteobacteria bacterium]